MNRSGGQKSISNRSLWFTGLSQCSCLTPSRPEKETAGNEPSHIRPTSTSANAFTLMRHNRAGDNSARAAARRCAGMESSLRSAWPRQGTGTPKTPTRASIGISDPADSTRRSATPTTAVAQPTTATGSPTESAALSAKPPGGPAAGSVRPAAKATGGGHHATVHRAAAEGRAGAEATPLVRHPAVDRSHSGHRLGGGLGRRGRC